MSDQAGKTVDEKKRSRSKKVRERGEQTRELIKSAALDLYLKNGLNGVSSREISRAAGQGNVASINYYFESQDLLIAELVQDVARDIDALYNQAVDEMEAAGGPHCLRDIVKLLLDPSIFERAQSEMDNHFYRFFLMLRHSHRDLLFRAMKGYDSGVRRCFQHISRLPLPVPEVLMRQRLRYVFAYVIAIGSLFEVVEDEEKIDPASPAALVAKENLADTVIAMISQPPSSETLASVETLKGAR